MLQRQTTGKLSGGPSAGRVVAGFAQESANPSQEVCRAAQQSTFPDDWHCRRRRVVESDLAGRWRPTPRQGRRAFVRTGPRPSEVAGAAGPPSGDRSSPRAIVADGGRDDPWALGAGRALRSSDRAAGCPYPLRLLGYRKHLAASASRPARTTAALVLTSVAAAERDAVATIQQYHQRGGTVELLNRQAKSYLGWRGHRLRHGPGLDILGQFVFAGLNFIPWLADTLRAEHGAATGERPGLAELTALAQTPADVLTDEDGVVVQFRPNSGWPNRSLRLGTLRQLPLPGFVWPGTPINAQMTLPNSDPHLVAPKLAWWIPSSRKRPRGDDGRQVERRGHAPALRAAPPGRR